MEHRLGVIFCFVNNYRWRGCNAVRESMKHMLRLRELHVKKNEFAYVELQFRLIRQLEEKLVNVKLNEVVPSNVFRAEVAKE